MKFAFLSNLKMNPTFFVQIDLWDLALNAQQQLSTKDLPFD